MMNMYRESWKRLDAMTRPNLVDWLERMDRTMHDEHESENDDLNLKTRTTYNRLNECSQDYSRKGDCSALKISMGARSTDSAFPHGSDENASSVSVMATVLFNDMQVCQATTHHSIHIFECNYSSLQVV